jgi:UPF0755 protein
MTKKKGTLKRALIFITIAVIVVASIAGWNIYNRIFAPNVQLGNRLTTYLLIPTGADFSTVTDSLSKNNFIKNQETYHWVAEKMHYPSNVKPGRYLLHKGMNNKELISLLRSGKQAPVKVTFNNLRTLEQLAGRISGLLESDSASIVNIFRSDSLLKKNGLNTFNSISILIPNTYEMYWNTSAAQFYERMNKEYHRFWNEKRKASLKEINLNRQEVAVIASIVEQETKLNKEKPVVAGVYINRYRKGWKLEADPTLVYAVGDFTIRRVLNEYKEIDSPYNTYMYMGLPPGPICIPEISSIDAVLNYAKHDYYFFCAKDDFSGYHAFANTYSEHLLNAKRFHIALTRRGIMN